MLQLGEAHSHKVSFGIVFPYFLSGLLALVASSFLLFLWSGHLIEANLLEPRILALVHLLALGWITSIMTGALYQMIPVLLNTPLFSQPLARLQLIFYVSGWTGMVITFATASYEILPISASVTACALVLLLWNLASTMARTTNWTLIGFYLVSALVYLAITLTVGVLMAFQLIHPFLAVGQINMLHSHALAAFGGWIAMTIMGVSLRLIPMFSLAHGYSLRPAWIAFALCNTGLLCTIVASLLGARELVPFCLSLFIAGLLAFLVQVIQIARSRLRKLPDLALTGSFFSYFCWIPALLGLFFYYLGSVPSSWNTSRVIEAFFFFLLFGPISGLILAQLMKIVPFLVWLEHYGPLLGKQQTPLPKDLLREGWAMVQLIVHYSSTLVGTSGVLLGSLPLLKAGALGLASSSMMFLILFLSVFFHLFFKRRAKNEQGESASMPFVSIGS